MSIKIALPSMRSRLGAEAHCYPLQIAIQTQEFLQATLFYSSFLDIAAGQAVSSPGGLERIEHQYISLHGSKSLYDEAWSYLERYRPVFGKTALKAVLVTLNSHWDWYIRKVGEFPIFAAADRGTKFSAEQEKGVRRLSALRLFDQIRVLEGPLGCALALSHEERLELGEMSLARNLGLHYRREVDAKYLSQTCRRGLSLGELRVVEGAELHRWHGLLVRLINCSSTTIARTYREAAVFPPQSTNPSESPK